MKNFEREKGRGQRRVYQYATGRGGVPIGDDSTTDDQRNDRVYQYATGRGGIPLSRNEQDSLRENFYGKGPKGWTRSDDRIKDEVCETLYSSYEVDASDIEVQVKEGTVTLIGTVNTRAMKRLAEDLIDDVSGVLDVQNQLSINRNVSERILKLS